MYRHQRTMVCLSGTEADRQLVSYASCLADLGFTRHFHFVHVRDEAPPVHAATSSVTQETMEALVTELFRTSRGNVSTSCHVTAGERVDRLIEFSIEQQCDLALLGHRAPPMGQRRLARRLAMIAPCSVLMLPETAPVRISTVMAPADLSEHSADSVQVAASIAQAAGASRVIVAHVYSDPSVIRYDEHKEPLQRAELKSLQEFLSRIENPPVELEPYVVEGHKTAESILFAAAQRQVDLLVVSTRGRSRAASILLGSVAAQLLIQSPVAVLTVKHFGSMMNLFQVLREHRFLTQGSPQAN